MGELPRVFVTGVTGYVGGDALFLITRAHPEWRYTFLVRDQGRVAKSVLAGLPNVRFVTGDLEQTDLIRTEAVAADVVMTFASSDDVASAEAVRDALTSDGRTRFWIHTSGAAILLFDDRERGVPLGTTSPKVWDDIGDIDAINSWPETVFHRPVEKIVLEAGARHHNVKSAVVCPPAILGVGRGPGNTRTIQVPILIEIIRQRGRAFQVGQGRARWSFVHIHDLSDIYLKLVDAAASKGGEGADWGHDGYYFVENGEMEWGHIGGLIARRLHAAGALPNADVDELEAAEAIKLFRPLGLGLGMVGANSRSRATRAKTRLGWQPVKSDLDAGIEELVDVELATGQSRLHDFTQGHMPRMPPSMRRDNKL